MTAHFRTSSLRSRTRLVRAWSTADLSVMGNGDKLAFDWLAAVATAGGTLTGDSESLIYALSNAIANWSGYTKILYFLPLLGGNFAASITPLIDAAAVGRPTNIGFSNAEYSEATGLTGNGVNKRLDLNIYPGAFMGLYGGMGLLYGLRTFAGQGTPNIPFTSYHSSGNISFGMVLYPTLEEFISSGSSPQSTPLRAIYTNSSTQSASDYYGQDSDGGRTLSWYRNGVALASNTLTDTVVYNYPELKLGLLGCANGGAGWWSADRIGCAMVTNGKLTPTEVAELHTILQDYLYTPTGR